MKRYSQEFKERLLKEVEEVGNVSVVAKKHNIPTGTVYSWISNNGNSSTRQTKIIDRDKDQYIKKLKKDLEVQELKITLLKDLLKKSYHLWETE